VTLIQGIIKGSPKKNQVVSGTKTPRDEKDKQEANNYAKHERELRGGERSMRADQREGKEGAGYLTCLGRQRNDGRKRKSGGEA